MMPSNKDVDAGSTGDLVNKWHQGWLSFGDFNGVLEGSELKLSDDLLVYLGWRVKNKKKTIGVVYWAIDVSESISLVEKLGNRQFCFVELRTLMVATDWADDSAMVELAITGKFFDYSVLIPFPQTPSHSRAFHRSIPSRFLAQEIV
ncbi:hypothetical protein L1887_02695 [Cichorium endivia]|nr:hypothetical protein L1887_02695 [Cichorium endivia]